MSYELEMLLEALEDELLDPEMIETLVEIAELDEEDVGIKLRRWHKAGKLTKEQWQVIKDLGMSRRNLVDVFGRPGGY